MPDDQGEIIKVRTATDGCCDQGVFVLHKAISPLAERRQRSQLGDFLGSGKAGPEHQAIIHLIGELVG